MNIDTAIVWSASVSRLLGFAENICSALSSLGNIPLLLPQCLLKFAPIWGAGFLTCSVEGVSLRLPLLEATTAAQATAPTAATTIVPQHGIGCWSKRRTDHRKSRSSHRESDRSLSLGHFQSSPLLAHHRGRLGVALRSAQGRPSGLVCGVPGTGYRFSGRWRWLSVCI